MLRLLVQILIRTEVSAEGDFDNVTLQLEEELEKSIIEDILAFEGVKVLEIDRKIVSQALKFSGTLLFSDAIHVSCCKIYGMTNMATNDSDFERISFLDIWKPQLSDKNSVDRGEES